MADLRPTYHFEGDEVFALYDNRVIASGKADRIDEVEKTALEYLESQAAIAESNAAAEKKRSATHIVTPNGIEGQIMGRTPTVWGDQITVRLANGTITHYTTRGDEEYVNKREASTAGSPVEALEARLSADYDHGKTGLIERLHELREVQDEATRLARAGAPYTVERKLDGIRTSAIAEAAEVKTALDYLESADAEAFEAPAAFQMHAGSQAELGHTSNDWLEVVAADMVAESEDQDLEKLLTEGPAVFVVGLHSSTLEDGDYVRTLAHEHIVSKTAGFEGDDVTSYRANFVTRVESARRAELANRENTTTKEAAVEHEAHVDAPDEALFM